MTNSDSYKTIKSVSSGIYKEKGSKFLAEAYPVEDETEIKSIIDAVRKQHHAARHHCYAYMLGAEEMLWRVNDAGEPSGTAGRPILGQIKSFGLTNVLIVVSRYFGGTLLGVRGLINAYKSAAASSLNNAEIIEHIMHESYEITYPYSAMNEVMKLLKNENVIHSDHTFDTTCRIKISIRSSAREKILNRLSSIEGLNYRLLSKS